MRLDTRFKFDSYVVGAGNRMAVAAARAVAEGPGQVYNPLFIYGTTGLGKTHLLGAVGQLAAALQPGLEVEYLSLDEFVGQLHAAVSAGQLEAFTRRYERVGVLLIDDVQFLTGRRETQAELLKLFERMQSAGRQIVLTSDRPPAEITDVDERLISRLSGGLIVDVSAPDFETRVAILRANCEERGLAFKTGVLEDLAKFDFNNVRELQGALNRLVAHQAIGLDEPAKPKDVPRRSKTEFQGFLSEVAAAVQHHVESWQARLREAAAFWSGEGYRTDVLERAMALPKEPDVAGLLETYTAAVEHLRELEKKASAVDARLGSDPVFRDPEKLAEAEDLVARALAGATPPDGPIPSFARDAFEVGASNQLAVHAADAVIASPGARYNPLVLHGPSGVGKTHLLNAVGNALAAGGKTGKRIVGCVHAQKFIDELIAAIQAGTVDRWRSRYRGVDALLLDDVHFVAGKERTQEEFFVLFNALVGAGKQIILSSDRAPGEIPDLEARLRSRFEGGLVVSIQPPDRPLRERLFAHYFAASGRAAEPDLVGMLAETPVQSVREIIGVVNRLGAVADATGTAITPQLARAELGLSGGTPFAGVAAVQGGRASRSSRESRAQGFLDPEKTVWEWPDVGARLIEELR